jgi:hypothetical protein
MDGTIDVSGSERKRGEGNLFWWIEVSQDKSAEIAALML